MLATRTIGLKEYILNGAPPAQVNDEQPSFFVDLNLVNISQLTQTFPSVQPFLGWEVAYIGLIHPIPRAVWPGKPEGLSVSIESALGANSSMTLSTTFVGEAYMAGGAFGVFLAGLFFGVISGWWGRFATAITSEIGFLIYASGFAAIAMSMRSLFWLTTVALPTIAAIALAMIFLRKSRGDAQQSVDAARQTAPGYGEV
jgi:hypothetical protein